MLKIITGDSASFTFSIVYPGAVDGVPTPDLSNATIAFAMKKRERKNIIIEKTVSNPETNIIEFFLTPEETAQMPAGVWEACCKVYYDNQATTVWMDTINVVEGVLVG